MRDMKLLEGAPKAGNPDKDAEQVTTTVANGGTKRKFELAQDDLDRAAQEDRSKARKAIDDEKVRLLHIQHRLLTYANKQNSQASKTSLPSFWTPSLTPDVHDSKLGAPAKKHKSTPTCPVSDRDHPHHFSLNKLIDIKFDNEAEPTSNEQRATCPSCRKVLSNALAPVIAKRCGHVLCLKCVKQFMIPSGKDKPADDIIGCFVCEEPVAVNSSERDVGSGLPTGLVALRSEGTGFSSKGSSTVGKTGLAFQC